MPADRSSSLLFPLVALLLAGCVADVEVPAGDNMLLGLPDLDQQGPPYAEGHNPLTLCAPVAVANSLLQLGMHGTEGGPVELVNALAGPRYMQTHRGSGTSPGKLMMGLRRYLNDIGVSYRGISYRGWRQVPDEFEADGPLSLEWLLRGIDGSAAVWLNLGWYQQSLPGVYVREGGHWVTLAGYRDGGLLVHDPGPWQLAVNSLALRQHRAFLLRSRLGSHSSYAVNEVLLELVGAPTAKPGMAMIDGVVRLDL